MGFCGTYNFIIHRDSTIEHYSKYTNWRELWEMFINSPTDQTLNAVVRYLWQCEGYGGWNGEVFALNSRETYGAGEVTIRPLYGPEDGYGDYPIIGYKVY